MKQHEILSLIGRSLPLLEKDIHNWDTELFEKVQTSSFLVLGGAGSIGQAVVKEIFKRNPRKLHVVDISENNLVELVRDIRSSFGYISGEFATFALDIGSLEFEVMVNSYAPYDYVLNLSALKHVRSEKDPYTLMRMLDVNIFNTDKSIALAKSAGAKKYFCVSTDKAANPVSMMGASKRIMEMFLMERSNEIDISTARFANVAFSDGSLLHGFNQRILKKQPIVAPTDIKRYFVTPAEAGELCLMSCLLGENRDIYFPKLSEELHLISFAEIAKKYLVSRGYEPKLCTSEDEARNFFTSNSADNVWPCYFSASDTSGEKPYEEFFTSGELVDLERFNNLGVIKNSFEFENDKVSYFVDEIQKMKRAKSWTKNDIVDLFRHLLPEFLHKETGKNLDSKM